MPPSTAIVLVDPYNEFLHPRGKFYPRVQESLLATNTVQHIQELVAVARKSHIPIYYALHQQYHDGHYDGWKHMNPSLAGIRKGRLFEKGGFGARIYEGLEPRLENGDVVVSKHWNSRLVVLRTLLSGGEMSGGNVQRMN